MSDHVREPGPVSAQLLALSPSRGTSILPLEIGFHPSTLPGVGLQKAHPKRTRNSQMLMSRPSGEEVPRNGGCPFDSLYTDLRMGSLKTAACGRGSGEETLMASCSSEDNFWKLLLDGQRFDDQMSKLEGLPAAWGI